MSFYYLATLFPLASFSPWVTEYLCHFGVCNFSGAFSHSRLSSTLPFFAWFYSPLPFSPVPEAILFSIHQGLTSKEGWGRGHRAWGQGKQAGYRSQNQKLDHAHLRRLMWSVAHSPEQCSSFEPAAKSLISYPGRDTLQQSRDPEANFAGLVTLQGFCSCPCCYSLQIPGTNLIEQLN